MKRRATKLKYVSRLVPGGTPDVANPDFWAGAAADGTPWVTIGDMTRAPRVTGTKRWLTRSGLADRRLFVGPPGTVLFAMYASVGAVAVLDCHASWNQAILGVVPQPDRANSHFLRYWLEALQPSHIALFRSNTQNNLNAEQVASLPYPTMSVEKQKAIADHLDTETARIENLIIKKQMLLERLTEHFESSIFNAATSGLRLKPQSPSGLAWVPSIPQGWTTPTVSVNFDVQLGKMLSADAAIGPDQYPYLRNVNVQWDRLDLDTLSTMDFDESDRRRFALRRGDLLVCEGGEVGRAAIWDRDDDQCFYQKALHRVRPRGPGNTRFLMYALRAAAKVGVFVVQGNLSTIVHLTREQLNVHRLPWPPDDEQAEIVAHLDRAARKHRNVSGRLAAQIQLLREHRQALITAAVTGEFAIPEVAS